MSGPCLSLPRIAKRYGVARTTVWQAIQSGELPAFRIGQMYRVRPDLIPNALLNKWLRSQKWAGLPTGPPVYFVAGVAGYVKIGFTTDLRTRMVRIQVGHPEPVRLLAWMPGSLADERRYHVRFASLRAESEWFKLAPEIEAEIARLNKDSGRA